MPSTRTIEVLPTSEDLFRAAAEGLVRIGQAAIAARGRFTVALSGGNTPKGLYSLLAKNYLRFNWRQTYIFFGDERHVPPEHPESNFRMVNETLVSKISISSKNVHRVRAENRDTHAAAAEYEEDIRQFFGLKPDQFPRFDLMLLGMGPDGHTASLFPNSQALKEQAKLVVANWVEKFNAYRITMTLPVLNHAAEAMFLVSGPDKADMALHVLEGENRPPFPAQRVRPIDGKLVWLLDEAAADRLSS
jgi:6-phosphogluconolactonase